MENLSQHRITKPGPLLDKDGHLAEPGYATSLLLSYDRSRIAASALRIKEWDYYYIGNDRYGLALTIADNAYMGLDSISLLNFEKRTEQTASRMCILPLGHRGLPATSERGDISVKGKDYALSFLNEGSVRHLSGYMDNFVDGKTIRFDITLTGTPKDSMVIATPFAGKPKAFYYNQKINCLRAEGKAEFDGKEYAFSPDSAFGVLDWGRGVWTYENTWYWGSASGLADGHVFGFNLGYGFGDTSAASENMLFCDGIASKLGRVRFDIPMAGGREDYLKPWHIGDDEGRLSLEFAPILDRSACMDFKLLLSDQHQVFGRFSGTAVLDDGQSVTVRELTGFAEKVHNKW